MRHRFKLFPICLALLGAAAGAAPEPAPVRVILVGDSTMASTTGYGDALCARLRPGSACINAARGGRSSRSFRAEGRWDAVQSTLRDPAGFGASYVLIQFGHNDQPGKPGRSTDYVREFPDNLRRYVEEARALGAIPVLVTPLARREFKGKYLRNDLAPWAEQVRTVARETNTAVIDLNALSVAAVEAMGPGEADKLARTGQHFDHTHLGPAGALRFAGIVSGELVRSIPALQSAFKQEP